MTPRSDSYGRALESKVYGITLHFSFTSEGIQHWNHTTPDTEGDYWLFGSEPGAILLRD